MSSHQVASWIEEEVFSSGDLFFDEILDAIQNAKRSVEVETFIFANDTLGRRVAQVLKAAAARRVRVRLCVDGVGSWAIERDFWRELMNSGVECKVYHALPWQRGSNGLTFSLARINRRNHRKLWIIDHEIAFVGSMNVSENHLESVKGENAWRDVGVKLKGPPVVWLRAAFETVWQSKTRSRHWKRFSELASRSGLGRSGRELVEFNLSRAARRRKNWTLFRRIENSKNCVWLVNPYFVPCRQLVSSLKSAAIRGVDVRLVIPTQSDVFFMPIIAKSYFGMLLKHGVKIYEFQPSMLHAKIVVIDDWVRIGSSNLNHRSLLHDLEVNVILKMERSLQTVRTQIFEYIKESVPARFQDWRMRGWPRMALEHVLGLLKRWI
jgi:cardiolipin synthase